MPFLGLGRPRNWEDSKLPSLWELHLPSLPCDQARPAFGLPLPQQGGWILH